MAFPEKFFPIIIQTALAAGSTAGEDDGKDFDGINSSSMQLELKLGSGIYLPGFHASMGSKGKVQAI